VIEIDASSAPALLPDSIHLFHVTDRKAAGFKPFSEVKDDLRKRISDEMYEKRFTEYMDKLRRDAFVKIYVPELAKLEEKKAS
jgi:parvulin-like peptidyl-prolyl isomerase